MRPPKYRKLSPSKDHYEITLLCLRLSSRRLDQPDLLIIATHISTAVSTAHLAAEVGRNDHESGENEHPEVKNTTQGLDYIWLSN